MASNRQKVLVVGAGPVGALAALYAAVRGDDVELYELRGGRSTFIIPQARKKIWSIATQDENTISSLLSFPILVYT